MRQTLDSGDYPHFFFVEKGHMYIGNYDLARSCFMLYAPNFEYYFENISVIFGKEKSILSFPKIRKYISRIFQKIGKIRVTFSKEKGKTLYGGWGIQICKKCMNLHKCTFCVGKRAEKNAFKCKLLT